MFAVLRIPFSWATKPERCRFAGHRRRQALHPRFTRRGALSARRISPDPGPRMLTLLSPGPCRRGRPRTRKANRHFDMALTQALLGPRPHSAVGRSLGHGGALRSGPGPWGDCGHACLHRWQLLQRNPTCHIFPKQSWPVGVLTGLLTTRWMFAAGVAGPKGPPAACLQINLIGP